MTMTKEMAIEALESCIKEIKGNDIGQIIAIIIQFRTKTNNVDVNIHTNDIKPIV